MCAFSEFFIGAFSLKKMYVPPSSLTARFGRPEASRGQSRVGRCMVRSMKGENIGVTGGLAVIYTD